MREKGLTIAGIAATIAFGVPTWWALFIEHPETADAFVWALRALTPIVIFLLGVFTGWNLRRWLGGERDMKSRIAELEKRPAEQTHSMDGTINANLTAVRSMSPLMAQAMLDAHNAPRSECEVSGKTGDAVDKSVKREDGVFFIRPYIEGRTKYYVLTQKWVEYLRNDAVLSELAKRANSPY